MMQRGAVQPQALICRGLGICRGSRLVQIALRLVGGRFFVAAADFVLTAGPGA